MLRFLRHFRQRLLIENKMGIYLLYAIGEILLVVIGILIALQVDNWNEGRKKAEQATDFRAQLREAILVDMENIRNRMDFFNEAQDYGKQMEQELADPKASDSEAQWQFIVQAFHVSQIWNFSQITATYAEAQNPEMLRYLGPPDLLDALQRYYNEWPLQLTFITGGTQAYRDYIRSVIPMELQKIMWNSCYDIDVSDIQRFLPCSVPVANSQRIEDVYKTVMTDPAYVRLLTRRLSTLYTRNIVYENILLEAEALLTQLNAF